LRELLKEEAKATTNGNISLLAEELIREGLKVKVNERIRKEDEMKNLIDKVTNARQIYYGDE
jgi:molybdopterin-biosynthesis enzyme MoeA-like protein